MRKIMCAVAACVSGILVSWLLAGCEVESADAPLTISPKSVRLKKGQSQEFVVSGGYTYRWTLSNYGYGMLSAGEGNRVVYTSTYSPNTSSTTSTTVQQTITVVSSIPGSGTQTATAGTTSSNGVPVTASVQAFVIQE